MCEKQLKQTHQKIEDLEVKVMYLEQTLSTLSDEFYQQQCSLNKLLSAHHALISRVEALSTHEPLGENVDSPVDIKPPHY